MKVDVSVIKRPGVKVEITLARGNRRGRRVNIPVRVAPYLAEEPADIEAAELFEETTFDVVEPEDELSDADLSPEENSEDDSSCVPEDDDIAAEPVETADQLNEVDPDEEELLRLIAEEEAEMAASQQNYTEPQPPSHYMSYLDRTESGDIFEVDDTHASGQKIVCVDGESGRISRVCGFIKNNQPAGDNSPNQSGEE